MILFVCVSVRICLFTLLIIRYFFMFRKFITCFIENSDVITIIVFENYNRQT